MVPRAAALADLPAQLADAEFWKLIAEFSEPGGYFRSDNLLSNEIWFQHDHPGAGRDLKPGGVYMGVGPEQNFTLHRGAEAADGVHHRHPPREPAHAADVQGALRAVAPIARTSCRCSSPGSGREGLTPKSPVAGHLHGRRRRADDDGSSSRTLSADLRPAEKKRALPLPADDRRASTYVYSALLHVRAGNHLQLEHQRRVRPREHDHVRNADDDQRMAPGSCAAILATEAIFAVMKDLESKNLVVPAGRRLRRPEGDPGVGRYISKDPRRDGQRVLPVQCRAIPQPERPLAERSATTSRALPLDDSSPFIYSQRRRRRRSRRRRLGSLTGRCAREVKASGCSAATSGDSMAGDGAHRESRSR